LFEALEAKKEAENEELDGTISNFTELPRYFQSENCQF